MLGTNENGAMTMPRVVLAYGAGHELVLGGPSTGTCWTSRQPLACTRGFTSIQLGGASWEKYTRAGAAERL